MAGGKHGLESSFFHVTKAAFTSENALKDAFQRFCRTAVPQNPELRSALISYLEENEGVTSSKPFTWYAGTTILPPLADVWLRESSRRLQEDTVVKTHIKFVFEDSLKMLRPNKMINDEIVDAYLELIRKLGVIISTTRLLTTAENNKLDPIDRVIDHTYIVQHGAVFIPIYDSYRLHWTYARIMASADSLSVEHYDSYQSEGWPDNLLRWVRGLFPGTLTSFQVGRSPQQPNAYDCGLYMLIGIRLMASGSDHLSEDDAQRIMPGIRCRVLSEILAGALNPTSSHYDQLVSREELEQLGEDSDSDIMEVVSYQPKPSVTLTTFQELQAEIHVSRSTGLMEKLDSASDAPIQQDSKMGEAHVDAQDITLPCAGDGNPEIADQDLLQRASILSVKNSSKDEGGLVQSYIRSFATADSMVSMLRASIASLKSTTRSLESESLASIWTHLDKKEKLARRHSRIKFSYRFWSEYHKIDGRVSQNLAIRPRTQRIRSEILLLLQHSDEKVYTQARTQASKAKIWTELIDSVAHLLPHGSWVAACGIAETTTQMEALSEEDRKTFIHGVLSRLNDPSDLALSNLRAANDIYCSLMAGSLPLHPLAIEGTTSLDGVSFADIVSVEKLPKLLRLPS